MYVYTFPTHRVSPMSMIRRQIYLTTVEVKQLAALAKSSGLSISEIVRRAIDEHLKRAQ